MQRGLDKSKASTRSKWGILRKEVEGKNNIGDRQQV